MTIPKLGFLALTEADSIDVLLDDLLDLGWANGKTFDVVFPSATQDLKKLEGNMQQLISAKVDVIVAQTKPAIEIACQATRSIPIVMGAYNGDPIRDGYAESIERPGGNVTGSFYNIESGARERIEVLLSFMPRLKTIGLVFNPENTSSVKLSDELADAANGLSLQIVDMPIVGTESVSAAFGIAKEKGVEGVVTVTAAEMFAIRRQVAAAQDEHHIPAVMGSIGYPSFGGLAKFGPEVPSLWRKMVPTVDKLLKGVAKTADLPLTTLDGFQLDINVDAAKRFGFVIPEAIRRRAVRVYPSAAS